MLNFEPEGAGYFVAEHYHEALQYSVIYIIEKYDRSDFSAWQGRALVGHDIVAQCELMPAFSDVVDWAEHTLAEIDAGRLWTL